MRKLLLCDLDTVLLYSKKLVKKWPPLIHENFYYRGTEISFFNGNVEEVLSIC